MKTYMPKSRGPEAVTRHWHVVDADRQILGRLASRVAVLLRGKHKPTYTPHLDTGDFVVVVNAAKVRLTGRKLEDKIYYRHSGYPGGLKATPAGKLLEQRPERLIQLAVKGMLPKNKIGRKMLTKLKVYAGPDHPHQAQQPVPVAPAHPRSAPAERT